MNKLLIFLFFNCCTQLLAQDSLTTADLQGTWHLTAIRIENNPLLNEDMPYEPGFKWRYPDLHWIIKGNKIYEIAYPCCLQNTYSFKTFKGGIFIKQSRGDGFEEMGAVVLFQKDSMTVDEGFYTSYTKYFFKDTLPTKEVNALIAGNVNPTCLYGDWEIPVGEVSVPYDAIMVWYPFGLPGALSIDAKNIHHYWANNRMYLEVDGVKRPFKVVNLSLHDDNLTLIPDNWIKQYVKDEEWETYQVLSVWLRKLQKEEE